MCPFEYFHGEHEALHISPEAGDLYRTRKHYTMLCKDTHCENYVLSPRKSSQFHFKCHLTQLATAVSQKFFHPARPCRYQDDIY